MNTQDEVNLYGLVSLRALAEFDPARYLRATDRSKLDIDREIDRYLPKMSEEIKNFVGQLRQVSTLSDNGTELAYLLQSVYLTCSLRAQQLSLQLSRSHETQRSKHPATVPSFGRGQRKNNPSDPNEESLLRLSVMRLLRSLPEYEGTFERRFGKRAFDAVLEPNREGFPTIIVEVTKLRRHSKHIAATIDQLKAALNVFGPESLLVLITDSIVEVPPDLPDNFFFLSYDEPLNEFIDSKTVTALMNRVNQSPSTESDPIDG
jgi:hypothetical protein